MGPNLRTGRFNRSSHNWQAPYSNMSHTPEDFAEALKSAGLAAFFADCTDAHRREYLKWITDAKRPETRKTRIAKALKALSEKRALEESRARKTR